MRFVVIHGPNLDALGKRQPEIYGTRTLAEIDDDIRDEAAELGVEVDTRQSAVEGEIVQWLHEAADDADGVVLNPAAYSHTSRAIADAIRSIGIPVVECHLSNIHAREPWRRRSVTAEAAVGIIAGFGPQSYVAALRVLHAIASSR